MKSTTALLARIEAERQEALAEAWEARRVGHDRPARLWAVHSLLRAGDISAAQFDAAIRLSSLLERACEGGGGACERVDGGDSDPHARAWDRAVSATAAGAAWTYVIAICPTRRRMLERLFAFPQPTLADLRRHDGDPQKPRAKYERVASACADVLAALELHFEIMDRGYGR